MGVPHPEVDEGTFNPFFHQPHHYRQAPGAQMQSQQRYVAVGQPFAAVAPESNFGTGAAAAGAATAFITPGHLAIAGAIGLVAGGFAASFFTLNQPHVVNADAYRQEAVSQRERAFQHEQRILEIQNRVCTPIY